MTGAGRSARLLRRLAAVTIAVLLPALAILAILLPAAVAVAIRPPAAGLLAIAPPTVTAGSTSLRAAPPVLRDIRLQGAFFSDKGAYCLPEAHGDMVFEVAVEGAEKVALQVVDPAEPETPLYSAGARLDDGARLDGRRRTLTRRWTPPAHAFCATVKVTAENRAGRTTVELAPLLHFQPLQGFEPVHVYGEEAPPWASWEPLPGLLEGFQVRGWLDGDRIWGTARGCVAFYHLRTGECRTLWLDYLEVWLHPDGSRLFFADERGLNVAGLDGGGRRLPVPVELLGQPPNGLIFSPDGAQAVVLVPDDFGQRHHCCRYSLESGDLQTLALDATPVAWVSAETLLVERPARLTRDGRRNANPLDPVGMGLALATLKAGRVTGLTTLTDGRDCRCCEFIRWADADRSRFVFLQSELEVRPGPENTVILTDPRRAYVTWDLAGGPPVTWEPPPGVALLPQAAPGRPGWAQRSVECPVTFEKRLANNLKLDLGLMGHGVFHPCCRLEYFTGLWGPYFTPAGDGVLTVGWYDPERKGKTCRTYLLTPRRDGRACGPR